jgi:AcrR family transcriptional regulator
VSTVRGRGRGRGRRPGGPDTRGEILDAARESFARKGYPGTTIRAVATSAGVDAALVHHYFGTKDVWEEPSTRLSLLALVRAGLAADNSSHDE